MDKTQRISDRSATRLPAQALAVALLAALAGCGHPDVQFSLNREGQRTLKEVDDGIRQAVEEHNEKVKKDGEGELRDAAEEIQEARDARRLHDQAIVNVLVTMFGTPDAPVAWGGSGVSGLDERKLRLAAGPADDPHGRGLYRKHCVHCHGVTGDGNGPTARFLNPYPRDFRRSLFKFKSTYPEGEKPTREDLMRTIREGINGTAMPSFKVLLRSDEVEALAEYVVYLTMRGETEIRLRNPLDNDNGLVLDANLTRANDEAALKRLIADTVAMGDMAAWARAPQQVFVPPDREEDKIARVDPAKLFAGAPGPDGNPRVKCTECHGPTGLGDGFTASETFDEWNKPKWNLPNRNPDLIAARFSLPLQRLQPRNLRLGIYRGGRRPVDLFRRIALGIFPSAMPAHAAIGADGKMSTSDATKLQPHEIWALVDYVLALPYEEGGELRRDVAASSETERH